MFEMICLSDHHRKSAAAAAAGWDKINTKWNRQNGTTEQQMKKKNTE